MLLSIVLYLVLVAAVLMYRPPLLAGSVMVIVGTVLLTVFSSGMWLLLLPTLAVLAVLNVPEWRRRLLVAPVYELLRKAMPPMSDTERDGGGHHLVGEGPVQRPAQLGALCRYPATASDRAGTILHGQRSGTTV